jgi:hypothetical protein
MASGFGTFLRDLLVFAATFLTAFADFLAIVFAPVQSMGSLLRDEPILLIFQQSSNPFAGRGFVDLFATCVFIGWLRAALQQELNDLGLLMA